MSFTLRILSLPDTKHALARYHWDTFDYCADVYDYYITYVSLHMYVESICHTYIPNHTYVSISYAGMGLICTGRMRPPCST